jgi:predicted RNase H-like HicB family nuclease
MKTPMQPDPRDYEIRIWYSAEKGDECFIAQVVEWPGIMAHGETREEAARQIQLVLDGALALAAEQGSSRQHPRSRTPRESRLSRRRLARRRITRHFFLLTSSF